MSNDNDKATKVAERFKAAMAVMSRNVAGHNWGWFSREDQRMHIQTVEDDAREGPNKAKAWLENRGRRTFERAVVGKLDGKDWKKLEAKVRAERNVLESCWVHFMISNKWLNADLNGSVVTITAYSSKHNNFTRTIDLRRIYPGAYPRWDTTPPTVDFDEEHGLLRVGTEENADHRNHVELSEFLFID